MPSAAKQRLAELSSLAMQGGVVLAETYPAEAYRHIGVSAGGLTKTQQDSRAGKAATISEWSARRGVAFDEDCHAQIDDGFGSDRSGEDRFDAFMGLLGMIEVADKHRPEGCPNDAANNRRRMAGKRPLPTTAVINLTRKQYVGGAARVTSVGSGSPKRPHDRVGHWRIYKSGKTVWIKGFAIHPDANGPTNFIVKP